MPITILAAYCSPQTNINIFLSELSTVLTSGPIQKNRIWIGDINIDILEKNTSLITENYLNILSSNGFFLKFNVINELSGRKVNTTGLSINEIIKDIYPTSTPKDYLNLVNSNFATTGKGLVDNNFPNSTNNIQSNFGINTNNKSNTSSNFKLDTIGSHEVKNILNNLNNNSAPGVDGYTALFFKQIGDNVILYILPVVHIINCSITNGTVPDELKVARIVPIHKKGDKTDFTNYRPISIVGILAKILEKIIKNQLLDYLERDKLIFTGQYGFRKNLGAEDALIDINNYLHTKRDIKKNILISFLDLEKAFDSISRYLLLNKLKELDFDDNALKWSTSYLSNRQLTTVGSHFSNHCYVEDYGVTQGNMSVSNPQINIPKKIVDNYQ
ncbi:hypothetical protein QTP88_006225 [Uroleucon formosanum]